MPNEKNGSTVEALFSFLGRGFVILARFISKNELDTRQLTHRYRTFSIANSVLVEPLEQKFF